MVGLDGYLLRPNTCPDRAVPPDDEELSHTHTLVRVKNTTRIVPTVVTSRVHCAMGKNFRYLVSHPGYGVYIIYGASELRAWAPNLTKAIASYH